MLVRNENKVRVVRENRTTDVWKEIISKMKRAARKRGLAIGDTKLNSLAICDRNNPDFCVVLDVDLMNTMAGEVILKLNGKIWKMGDTFIRDRKNGGEKRPDMDHQIENILDNIVPFIEDQRRDADMEESHKIDHI